MHGDGAVEVVEKQKRHGWFTPSRGMCSTHRIYEESIVVCTDILVLLEIIRRKISAVTAKVHPVF